MKRHPSTNRATARISAALPPVSADPAASRRQAADLRRLKAELAAEWTVGGAADAHRIRLVLNEAEALAWQTPFPTLFFPALAREKAQHLLAWQARQAVLRRRGTVISFAA